jgi:hypothetical protein
MLYHSVVLACKTAMTALHSPSTSIRADASCYVCFCGAVVLLLSQTVGSFCYMTLAEELWALHQMTSSCTLTYLAALLARSSSVSCSNSHTTSSVSTAAATAAVTTMLLTAAAFDSSSSSNRSSSCAYTAAAVAAAAAADRSSSCCSVSTVKPVTISN